jgi:hypothetical protein
MRQGQHFDDAVLCMDVIAVPLVTGDATNKGSARLLQLLLPMHHAFLPPDRMLHSAVKQYVP